MSGVFSKFTTSLMGLLSESAPKPSAKARLDDIRQAMLNGLDGVPVSHQLTKVSARILYAPDVQSLWYLRGDVMTLLAEALGESVASARLATISTLFVGLLPSAQKSRPTRLHQ